MTTPVVKPNSTKDQDLNVSLHNLMEALGYENHNHFRSRFETFVSKLNIEKRSSLKSYTYISPKTYVVVDSYMMTKQTAMAFAMYVNPDKGYTFIAALSNAHPEPAPIPYFTAKSCNKRIDNAVAKVYT